MDGSALPAEMSYALTSRKFMQRKEKALIVVLGLVGFELYKYIVNTGIKAY